MTYVSTVVSINLIISFIMILVIIAVVIGVYITLKTVNNLLVDIDNLVSKIDTALTESSKDIKDTVTNGYNQILDKCIVGN